VKNIRPFGWVIIALNIYFLYAFFSGVDGTESDTALGLGFMFLMFWLAIMNVVLYVIYRVTGGKKRDCPACGVGVKKGLTVCPSCNFDFMKAAGGEVQEDLREVVQKDKNELLSKYDELPVIAQFGLIFLLIAIGLYGGTWLLAPFVQDADYINCGIDRLLNIGCNYRYKS
jgi:hypothetical protein